jgi:hypothetical protein
LIDEEKQEITPNDQIKTEVDKFKSDYEQLIVDRKINLSIIPKLRKLLNSYSRLIVDGDTNYQHNLKNEIVDFETEYPNATALLSYFEYFNTYIEHTAIWVVSKKFEDSSLFNSFIKEVNWFLANYKSVTDTSESNCMNSIYSDHGKLEEITKDQGINGSLKENNSPTGNERFHIKELVRISPSKEKRELFIVLVDNFLDTKSSLAECYGLIDSCKGKKIIEKSKFSHYEEALSVMLDKKIKGMRVKYNEPKFIQMKEKVMSYLEGEELS